MHKKRYLGFSLMGPIVLVVIAFIAGSAAYWYGSSVWVSVIVGIVAAPIIIYLSVTILDVIFNNPISLRFQNYAGNHNCPSCGERYEEYTSQVTEGANIIIKCLKCRAENEYDKNYIQVSQKK